MRSTSQPKNMNDFPFSYSYDRVERKLQNELINDLEKACNSLTAVKLQNIFTTANQVYAGTVFFGLFKKRREENATQRLSQFNVSGNDDPKSLLLRFLCANGGTDDRSLKVKVIDALIDNKSYFLQTPAFNYYMNSLEKCQAAVYVLKKMGAMLTTDSKLTEKVDNIFTL